MFSPNSRSEYRCGRPLISGLIKHCPRSETRPLNTQFILYRSALFSASLYPVPNKRSHPKNRIVGRDICCYTLLHSSAFQEWLIAASGLLKCWQTCTQRVHLMGRNIIYFNCNEAFRPISLICAIWTFQWRIDGSGASLHIKTLSAHRRGMYGTGGCSCIEGNL